MVIVSTTGGSNIGFISREIDSFELQCLNEATASQSSDLTNSTSDTHSSLPLPLIPTKKILSKLKDGDETIHNLLLTKVTNERHALAKCHSLLRGFSSTASTSSSSSSSLSDSSIEIFAIEIQFDQKKLFLYLLPPAPSPCTSLCSSTSHRRQEISHFVGKLFEIFKMKIKIIEVENEETVRDSARRYLTLSKLPVSLVDLLPPPAPSPAPTLTVANVSYGYAHGPAAATAAPPPAHQLTHQSYQQAASRYDHHHDTRYGASAPHYPQHQYQYERGNQGNATSVTKSSHRYTSLYPHPNASLQSDLALYGPPSLKYSSARPCPQPLPQGQQPPWGQESSLPSSGASGCGPPQAKRSPHHGLLGPLMLLSPSGMTSSSHPYLQRIPPSQMREECSSFSPQEYHQNIPMLSPPAPPPYFDPKWYGGLPPPQSHADNHPLRNRNPDQFFDPNHSSH
jgi:hypothetical protein